jgi:hypothetical protein
MNTQSLTARRTDLDDPTLREADASAVLERLVSGVPLEPEIAERVHARAEQITEDIRRTHGLVDDGTFQSLLDDEA